MSKQNPTKALTDAGRIVWGHPRKLRQKISQETKKPMFKDDGSPVMVAAFGLAIPKAQFLANTWPLMESERMQGFPQGVPPKFSYKIKDGDTNDSKGIPYSKREGWAGCYVLTISTETGNPPQVARRLANGQFQQMADEEIKTGDYVRAEVNFVVNIPASPTHTPGLYVNPNIIEFLGYGQPIYNGPDAAEAFSAPVALPPGASATPLAPVAGSMPPAGPSPAPAPASMPGVMPTPASPFVPAAVPVAAPPAATLPPGMPGAPSLAPLPIASPSSPAPVAALPPAAPALDFVRAAPPPPPAASAIVAYRFDVATGRGIGRDPATGQDVWV